MQRRRSVNMNAVKITVANPMRQSTLTSRPSSEKCQPPEPPRPKSSGKDRIRSTHMFNVKSQTSRSTRNLSRICRLLSFQCRPRRGPESQVTGTEEVDRFVPPLSPHAPSRSNAPHSDHHLCNTRGNKTIARLTEE